MDTILSIIVLLITCSWAIATFVIANEREELLPDENSIKYNTANDK